MFKVKRVLPKWLANPTIISVNLQELHVKVKDMKELHKSLRKTLKKNGVKYFFPVQATVIPWLLESNKQAKLIFPRDVCVSAPTGSGKTLAFVLPIIQALMDYSIKAIRALIILPTQDLALQVFKAFQLYTKYTNLNVALATGKSKFCIEQKQLVYENVAFGYMNKVDILVCTAGRLVDHLKNTKGFSLKNLEFLVIDEADRVLDSVQNDWLYHLEKHILEEGIFLQYLNLFLIWDRSLMCKKIKNQIYDRSQVKIYFLLLRYVRLLLFFFRFKSANSKRFKLVHVKKEKAPTKTAIFSNLVSRSGKIAKVITFSA